MKKLLSLFLALMMVFSLVNVGFASSAATINGWSGNYSVEAYSGRDAAVKISNSATVLDPAMSFSGVVMLTADVYASSGGTISLEDGSGNQAGVITLADGKINGTQTSYSVDGWNTLKIFAMTGIKKYQVYLGDTFVCEADTTKNVIPSLAEFSSSGDIYVDNVSINQMEKKNAYPDSDITYSYKSSDFTGVEIGRRVWGLEDWTEICEYNTGVWYDVAEDEGVGRAIKMANTPNGSQVSSSRNMIRHAISTEKENNIFEMEFYIPSEVESGTGKIPNEAEIKIYARNTSMTAKGIIGIYPDNIAYNTYYHQRYAMPKDRWFKLRIEALYEQQGVEIYVDNTKITPYPIPMLESGVYGSMPALSNVDLFLADNRAVPTLAYMRNIKFGQAKGEIVEEVFSENFNSDAAKFNYTRGKTDYGADFDTLSLTSNATMVTGATGKGKLYSTRIVNSDYATRVTESCPIVIPSGDSINNYIDSAAKSETAYVQDDARFYSNAFDLSGASDVTVKFKFYNAAMSRRAGQNFAIDSMRMELHKDIIDANSAIKNVARPHLRFYRYDLVIPYDANTESTELVYHSNGTNGVKTWYDAALTITPGASTPFNLNINGRTTSFGSAFTADELSEYKYLSFEMESDYGGCYYLDDVSVSKKLATGEDYVKSLYSVDKIKTYTDTVSLPKEAEAAVEITFTDGKYNSGAPKAGYKVGSVNVMNKDIADDSKIVVATYNKDNQITDITILDKQESGVYDVTSKNMSVTADSKVKVFNLKDMSTLTPLDASVAVDKNIDRAKLFVIGDSTSQYYSESVKETEIHGFGDFLTDYVDSNKLEIINYGKSGRSAKSIVNRDYGDTAFDELFGAQGAVGAGDYVLICLGINDTHFHEARDYSNPYDTEVTSETEGEDISYRLYMKKIIDAVKAKGAYPILAAEAPRLKFSDAKDTVIYDELQNWILATYKLGDALEIPVIDAYGMAIDYMNKVGYEAAEDEFRVEADGSIDTTHYNLLGAKKRAELICKGLKLINYNNIADYIK